MRRDKFSRFSFGVSLIRVSIVSFLVSSKLNVSEKVLSKLASIFKIIESDSLLNLLEISSFFRR